MNRNSEPTALVATLDGRIHLVESNSMRVLWSLASGPPLYTSYQAQDSTSGSKNSRYFIDCGDDWNLYLHRGHFGREVCHKNAILFVCLFVVPFFAYN